jgi:hypothetical protein
MRVVLGLIIFALWTTFMVGLMVISKFIVSTDSANMTNIDLITMLIVGLMMVVALAGGGIIAAILKVAADSARRERFR